MRRNSGRNLPGVPPETFVAIQGDFAWRPHAATGTRRDAEMLAAIDLDAFYKAESDEDRLPHCPAAA